MEGNRLYSDFAVIGHLHSRKLRSRLNLCWDSLHGTRIQCILVIVSLFHGFITILFNGVQSELLGQPLTAIRSANQYLKMSLGPSILIESSLILDHFQAIQKFVIVTSPLSELSSRGGGVP